MHFNNLSINDLQIINSFYGPAYNKDNFFEVILNIEERNGSPSYSEPKRIYGFDPWEEIGYMDGQKIHVKIEGRTGWIWYF